VPEVIWWYDDSWWERKSIPLGGFNMAPRQVFLLLVFGAIGLIFDLIPIFNLISKLVVILVFVIVGGLFSAKRVKTVPIELQVLYMYRKYGRELGRAEAKEDAKPVITEKDESDEDLVIDNWVNPRPLSFSGSIQKVRKKLKVSLLVDGEVRMTDVVSKAKPTYNLVYIPKQEDVGTREIKIVVEGIKEPLAKQRLTVRSAGIGLLESRERLK
jgi:hypothetical protein